MENIFQKSEIVGRYTKARGVPPNKVFKYLARELLKKVRSTFSTEEEFFFLEPGIGNGRFAIPLAKALRRRVLIYGFDNSKPMLAALHRQVEQEKITNVKTILWNIEKEEPPNDWRNKFHLCILSYLLPHVKDWKKVLDTLIALVKVDGYLAFVREEAPLVKLRYNCCDSIENEPAYQFWQEYHRLRKNKLVSKGFTNNSENFVCDFSEALRYLREKGFVDENMMDQNTKLLSWKRKTSISDMVETLKYRDFLIFRLGLTKNEQIELWKKIENWCIEKDYLFKVLNETPKLIVRLMKWVR